MIVTVLGVAFAIAALAMFRVWLSFRQQKKELDNRVQLSQLETERLSEGFADAAKANPTRQLGNE